jgi:hypothetical protein
LVFSSGRVGGRRRVGIRSTLSVMKSGVGSGERGYRNGDAKSGIYDEILRAELKGGIYDEMLRAELRVAAAALADTSAWC